MLLGLIYGISILGKLMVCIIVYFVCLGILIIAGVLLYLGETAAVHYILEKNEEKLKDFYDFQLKAANTAVNIYKLICKLKWLTLFFAFLLIAVPPSKVMYTMAGIYLGQELLQTTEVNSILSKSVQLLEQKIDEELEESSKTSNKK